MTSRQSIGPRGRAVGGWLRLLREERDVTVAAAAATMGWSSAKMSRIEGGQNCVSLEDAAGLLGHYGVNGERRERVLALLRPVDASICWGEPEIAGQLPEGVLSVHESASGRIVQWSSQFIPEPLQTLDYARVMFAAGGALLEDATEHLADVDARSRIVSGQRVPYVVFLGQVALCTPLSGSEHRQQLGHLFNMSHRVTVRVVPQRASGSGLGDGWTMFHYANAPKVVRIRLMGASVYLSRDALLPYCTAETRLAKVALSVEQSRRLIESMIDRPTDSGDRDI